MKIKQKKVRKPLLERPWFGKRRLAFMPNLEQPYTLRGEGPFFEGDTYEVTYEDAWGGPTTGVKTVYGYECNLATSLLPNGNHAVSLDLDYAAKLRPSRTKGHYHLYLDPQKQLSWRQYRKLLKVLAECGLIEQGYYDASVRKGYTALRVPSDLDRMDEILFEPF